MGMRMLSDNRPDEYHMRCLKQVKMSDTRNGQFGSENKKEYEDAAGEEMKHESTLDLEKKEHSNTNFQEKKANAIHPELMQCRNLAYCLQQLNYTPGAMQKLTECFKFYQNKLVDKETLQLFLAIVHKFRKNAKDEFKQLVDEFEEQLKNTHRKLVEDHQTSSKHIRLAHQMEKKNHGHKEYQHGGHDKKIRQDDENGNEGNKYQENEKSPDSNVQNKLNERKHHITNKIGKDEEDTKYDENENFNMQIEGQNSIEDSDSSLSLSFSSSPDSPMSQMSSSDE